MNVRGLDALCARRPRNPFQVIVGELENLLDEDGVRIGDAGTGGAPSLPLEPDTGPDYGPTPAQLQEVAAARAAKSKPSSSGSGSGYAQIFKPPAGGGGGAPDSPSPNWFTSPLWKGAPVRVWQAGVGALGFFLLVTGIAVAARR